MTPLSVVTHLSQSQWPITQVGNTAIGNFSLYKVSRGVRDKVWSMVGGRDDIETGGKELKRCYGVMESWGGLPLSHIASDFSHSKKLLLWQKETEICLKTESHAWVGLFPIASTGYNKYCAILHFKKSRIPIIGISIVNKLIATALWCLRPYFLPISPLEITGNSPTSCLVAPISSVSRGEKWCDALLLLRPLQN